MGEEDQVQVPVADLEVIRAALNAAYNGSVARDLVEQYRKLSNRQQYSALTKALEGALDVATGHLSVEE